MNGNKLAYYTLGRSFISETVFLFFFTEIWSFLLLKEHTQATRMAIDLSQLVVYLRK